MTRFLLALTAGMALGMASVFVVESLASSPRRWKQG